MEGRREGWKVGVWMQEKDRGKEVSLSFQVSSESPSYLSFRHSDLFSQP